MTNMETTKHYAMHYLHTCALCGAPELISRRYDGTLPAINGRQAIDCFREHCADMEPLGIIGFTDWHAVYLVDPETDIIIADYGFRVEPTDSSATFNDMLVYFNSKGN